MPKMTAQCSTTLTMIRMCERGCCRGLVDRANDWLRENNDVEVKSCETVTWLSHDAASLSAGSELMVLSKRVAPPVVNTHCYRGLRYTI